jgi:hypothetical protein
MICPDIIDDFHYFCRKKNMPIRNIYSYILVFLFTLSACAQNNESKNKTSNQTEQAQSAQRKTMESPIVPPSGQEIDLEELPASTATGNPTLRFSGHENGSFIFSKSYSTDADLYPEFLFFFDNFEPKLMKTLRVPYELPEGNHIVAVALVDADGYMLKTPGSYSSTMIKVEKGKIIKTADAGVMLYYNQPRRNFEKDEAVILDCLITNPPADQYFELHALIDNEQFFIDLNTRYRILGLKPGNHMLELRLIRFETLFEKPMNPSRMVFSTK